ncbi:MULTISPECIES: hypothetical protein [unclassified Bdellovibrio]|nr:MULTISPECIES: hypothetical protein [unclassified Bdellovibrio]
MIVAMWFTMVGLVIIAGFAMVGLTLRHWAQQKKVTNGAKTVEK